MRLKPYLLVISAKILNRKKLPSLLDLRASVCMFWGEGGGAPVESNLSNFMEKRDMLSRNFTKWMLAAVTAVAGLTLSASTSQAHFHGGWGSSSSSSSGCWGCSSSSSSGCWG